MSADLILATGWGWGAWLWLMVPLAIYAGVSLLLFAMGRNNGPGFTDFFFGNISDSLRRSTGFPGWSMAGVLSGLLFLLVLVIGFYWDVAWHIDNGRDIELFTPSHVMILVGLGGIIYTAYLTMLFATLEDVKTGFRVGFVQVPWSSLLLLSLGVGGVVAFPLDNLWHAAYGLDVTLWSPTHLQLLGGGTLATIALFLMCAEALPDARPTLLGRFIMVLTGGTVLVALSTFMGEFEFGVPQFQALYLPVLIVVAGSMALVLTRLALGPWGAVKVVAVYLVLRVFLSLAIGGAGAHRAAVPAVPAVGAAGGGGCGGGGDPVPAAAGGGRRRAGRHGRGRVGAGVGAGVGVGGDGRDADVDPGEDAGRGAAGGGGGLGAGCRHRPGVPPGRPGRSDSRGGVGRGGCGTGRARWPTRCPGTWVTWRR